MTTHRLIRTVAAPVDRCRRRSRRTPLALTALALAPAWAGAQPVAEPPPGQWRYGAAVYGYLPTLTGTSRIPVDSGTPIEVSTGEIIDALKFTFMGSLSAHNGRWGGFTDLMYVDLGGDKQQTRDFTIGNIGLPATTAADIGIDLKGVIWTLGGEYRLVSGGALTLDAVLGGRLLDLRQTTSWSITGELGPIDPAARTGGRKQTITNWDGIVGVNGRVVLDSERRWSLPFYVDVGTGESDLTWQAVAGISYAFHWGELTARWRYLAYEMKSGQAIKDLSFSGPVVGAVFRW